MDINSMQVISATKIPLGLWDSSYTVEMMILKNDTITIIYNNGYDDRTRLLNYDIKNETFSEQNSDFPHIPFGYSINQDKKDIYFPTETGTSIGLIDKKSNELRYIDIIDDCTRYSTVSKTAKGFIAVNIDDNTLEVIEENQIVYKIDMNIEGFDHVEGYNQACALVERNERLYLKLLLLLSSLFFQLYSYHYQILPSNHLHSYIPSKHLSLLQPLRKQAHP